MLEFRQVGAINVCVLHCVFRTGAYVRLILTKQDIP